MNNRFDRYLLVATAALIVSGMVMIYSSTSVITPVLARRNVTQFFYFKRHLLTVLTGIVFMIIASRLSTETLKRMSIPLLIFSFILLILVFIPGVGISAGGARRWIRLWPSTFQPSEMVKFAMVLFLAWYMSRPAFRTDSITSLAIPVAVMGLFLLFFLRQPDFGAAMSLGLLAIAMLVLSGLRMRYIMLLVVMIVPVLVKLLMEPYRFRRILSFLNPWKDPQGGGFQIIQSLIALGSGGMKGIGLGESKQKLSFLPESHTDFIFSLIGEELGFIGASIIVCLFLFIFIRGVLIASRTGEQFSYYLASGLSMMIALQALINFSVTTGLAPTKGLPLPFISYGGSSLLVNMVAVGILLNLSKGGRRRETGDRTGWLLERKKALLSVYGRRAIRCGESAGQETKDNGGEG